MATQSGSFALSLAEFAAQVRIIFARYLAHARHRLYCTSQPIGIVERFRQFGLDFFAHAHDQILFSIITPGRVIHGANSARAKFTPAD